MVGGTNVNIGKPVKENTNETVLKINYHFDRYNNINEQDRLLTKNQLKYTPKYYTYCSTAVLQLSS